MNNDLTDIIETVAGAIVAIVFILAISGVFK